MIHTNNPVGIFYTYYPFTDDVEWERCIRRAAASGADSIEISSMRLVHEDAAVQDRIMQVAKEVGIRTSFTTGFPADCDMSSDDPAIRQKAIRFMADNIRLVHRMGGSIVGGVFHGQNFMPRHGEYSLKQRRLDNAVLAVRELAKIAEEYGVVLADEAVNRFESETINTAAEELAFLDRVDSPWVKVLLDTFHMNIEEDDIPAAIHLAGNRIAHIHLAEGNRKLPGNASLDWKSILNALNDVHYDSFLTMESFQTPYPGISDGMCIWRDLCTKGVDEDVTNAVFFLKSLMRDIN